MEKMNWNNLKNMKCPKCGYDLITNNTGSVRMIGCEDEEKCDFVIRKDRFDSLIDDIYKGKSKSSYKPQFGDDSKNLEYLNNFDQKEADLEIDER